MVRNNIRYAEIFHSVQGEGQNVGLNTIFLRLSGCNLQCEFCDSKYHTEGITIALVELAKLIGTFPTMSLTITGGEPLLQQENIVRLGNLVNHVISIETNGTVIPRKELLNRVTYWACSPKLGNSGNDLDKRMNYNALEALNKAGAMFKFVISTEADVEEVLFLQDQINIPSTRIYLMPEGTELEEINKKAPMVVELCKKYGFNFSPRLHINMWGSKRGV